MMILIFGQWGVNNEVDAYELYKRAYPEQASNQLLANIFKETLEAGKSDQVDDTTVFSVVEIFGNSDLAFEVQGVNDKRKQEKSLSLGFRKEANLNSRFLMFIRVYNKTSVRGYLFLHDLTAPNVCTY